MAGLPKEDMMTYRALIAVLTTAALTGCSAPEAPEPGDLEASTMSVEDYDFYASLEDKTTFFTEDGRCADVIVSDFRGGRDEVTNTLFLQYPGACIDGLTTIDFTRVRVDEAGTHGRYYGKVLTGEGDSLVLGEWYQDPELHAEFVHIVMDTHWVEVDVEIKGMVVVPEDPAEDEYFIGYVAF